MYRSSLMWELSPVFGLKFTLFKSRMLNEIGTKCYFCSFATCSSIEGVVARYVHDILLQICFRVGKHDCDAKEGTLFYSGFAYLCLVDQLQVKQLTTHAARISAELRPELCRYRGFNCLTAMPVHMCTCYSVEAFWFCV